MNIVTISRELGSGGRELGKRLADELGVAIFTSSTPPIFSSERLAICTFL